MIAQFTLIPLGTKMVRQAHHTERSRRADSLSKSLAKAVQHIVESGLDYKAGPMGTVVEGEWYEIMNLINRCRKTLRRDHSRVQILINIDDRQDAKGRIAGKVQSLERKMGVKLRK